MVRKYPNLNFNLGQGCLGYIVTKADFSMHCSHWYINNYVLRLMACHISQHAAF